MWPFGGSSSKTAKALDDASQRKETLDERLQSVLADLEVLEAQVDDAESTRNHLEQRHASAVAEVDRLSNDIEARERDIVQLQATLIERMQARDELKDNIERTQNNIKDVIARYAPDFVVPAVPAARPSRPAHADDEDDDVPLSQRHGNKKRPHVEVTKSASVVVDGGNAAITANTTYAPPKLELGGDVCFSTFCGKGNGQTMVDVRRWMRRADGTRVPMTGRFGRKDVGVTMTPETFLRELLEQRSAAIDEALEIGRSVDLPNSNDKGPSVHVFDGTVRIRVGDWQAVSLTRDQWTALKRAPAVM